MRHAPPPFVATVGKARARPFAIEPLLTLAVAATCRLRRWTVLPCFRVAQTTEPHMTSMQPADLNAAIAK